MCPAQALKKSGSDGRFSWQSKAEGAYLSATTRPAAASPGTLFPGIAYPSAAALGGSSAHYGKTLTLILECTGTSSGTSLAQVLTVAIMLGGMDTAVVG